MDKPLVSTSELTVTKLTLTDDHGTHTVFVYGASNEQIIQTIEASFNACQPQNGKKRGRPKKVVVEGAATA